MKWRSEETIKAYDHYFDSLRHAEIQDILHAQMDEDLKQYLSEQTSTQQNQPQSILSAESQNKIPEESSNDDEFNYLRSIGGKNIGY